MNESRLYIPLTALDRRLRERIPSGEKVLYTSRCAIEKKSFREGGKTFGHLAITNRSIIFVATKIGFGTSRGAWSGNIDTIPLSEITEFKNKKNMISIKLPDPFDLKKDMGYNIWVERCKTVGEDPKDFKERKNLFGNFVENLYYGREGKLCPICNNIIQNEDESELCPNCDVPFHYDCFVDWIKRHKQCRQCKIELEIEFE
ncbi:MAG: hypothetical protein ACFFDN_04670 [Candidatus Hodarchaeota archaeon]